jgi:hypothetical protein
MAAFLLVDLVAFAEKARPKAFEARMVVIMKICNFGPRQTAATALRIAVSDDNPF